MIELRDVWFRYEGSEDYALRGISLEIRDDDFVLLVGPSGAGKSTLLRTLNGLIPHFYSGEMKGVVLVDGVDTKSAPISELAKKVGLVFQNPERMFFSQTLLDELMFGPINLGADPEEAKKRALSVAKQLHIDHLLNRPPWTLSGGEMKRASVAAVLTMETPYVALDEPTQGQDARTKEALIEVVSELRSKGRAVIVVSHDVEWLADLSPDSAVVLDGGKVAIIGRGEEVLADVEVMRRCSLSPPICVQVARMVGLPPKLTPSGLLASVLER